MNRAERRAEKARQRKRNKRTTDYTITLDASLDRSLEVQLTTAVQALPDDFPTNRLVFDIVNGDADDLERLGKLLETMGAGDVA